MLEATNNIYEMVSLQVLLQGCLCLVPKEIKQDQKKDNQKKG